MSLFAKAKVTEDVLAQKKKTLAAYTSEFNGAVSLVTNTIDNLSVLSENIDRTISEIEEYQNELNVTKNGLVDEKQKTDRVIQNFKALLVSE